MNQIEKALKFSANNYNCAQSVFAAYCDWFDVSENLAKQIAAGFGAGVGKSENICGAITGAVMLLGLKNYHEFGNLEEKEKIYAITQRFVRQFKEIHGSDNCQILLDLKEKNNFECSRYIQSACEILEKDFL
ncbi:MAG: C_GCAxxG_C_C family protein [Candidatus Marinimicrobia bacterium]|nr:C_GCAxxG_C_C family protein [Candidatus Neomarinimicrobiota bacterium]